jgi:hypothetical protein
LPGKARSRVFPEFDIIRLQQRPPISAGNTPQFLANLRAAFLVFTALCLCGIFASLARGTMHDGKQ